MLSYLFMKILENRPSSYDRRMNKFSLGQTKSIKENVAGEIPENARVLEIGCGTGELAAMLLNQGATVTAFDANPAMVEMARKRFENLNFKNKLTIGEMGVEGMDGLPSAFYDAVVATLVFSELSEDERRFALKHSLRVLKHGGILVIADEVVPRKAVGKLLQFLTRIPMLALAYLVSRTSTRPLADLPGEMKTAGFTIQKEVRTQGDAFAEVVARVSEKQ